MTGRLGLTLFMAAACALAARAQAPDARNVDPAVAGRGRGQAAAKTPKDGALIDLTGYWVSIVSEDWRFRMVRAPKGDYPDVPLNPEGKKVADAWDASEKPESCKAYGAPNVMRQPTRLHITWADDRTLKIETDAGVQTRLLRFPSTSSGQAAAGQAAVGPPSRQGNSVANWEGRAALKVATSNLLPGYLQTNGVPFSGKATMTEYFDIVKEPNGDVWLIHDASVEDPTYLVRSMVRSTHFRKEKDGSKWDPTPCWGK